MITVSGPSQAALGAIFFEKESLEMPQPIIVKAAWDSEAQVWYIQHSDLRGLHLEAETPIELYKKLPGAIEDLLEGNGEREVSFEFFAVYKAPGHVKIAA